MTAYLRTYPKQGIECDTVIGNGMMVYVRHLALQQRLQQTNKDGNEMIFFVILIL